MAGRTRVLVVDDSALVRNQVAGWIEAESDLAVAGTAANGRQALEKLAGTRADVVVLDLEMPVLDGLGTLREMARAGTHVPVIVFSALSTRGGSLTLEALSLGAADYVLKPTNLGDVRVDPEEARRQLLEKLRALREPTKAAEPTRAPARLPEPARGRLDAVVIGASTGGPNALEAIFQALPGTLPVPVLVVQHMPPFFTRILADRLARVSQLQVDEAVPGREPRPGEAWVAPGGVHLVVERRGDRVVLETNEEPPENACRPAVDVLFRAAALAYGEHVLGVVLTGMGQDGLAGAETLRRRGARVVVQDADTSVVWSMPGHVARAGLACAVLTPTEIAAEITSRAFASRVAPEAT